MNADPVKAIHKSKKSTRKAYTNNLEGVLYQENQSLDANYTTNPTVNLTTTFHTHTGEENQ